MSKPRIDSNPEHLEHLEGYAKFLEDGEVHEEKSNDYFLQLKEAQNAIEENGRDLMEAQRLAGLGSWEFDVSANKVYWSDEMKEIFGYSSSEPLDYERYLSLLHPEDREMVNRIVSNTLQTNEPYSLEHKIIRKDGSVRYLLANGYTVLSEANELLKLRGTALDITAIKSVAFENFENQNFINKVAKTTPDVISVFDLEKRRNIYTNKDFYPILGYTSEEINAIRNKPITALKEVFHPDDFDRVIGLLASYEKNEEGGTKEIEYRIKHKEGHWVWVMARYNIFKRDAKGNPKQIIGVSRNITKRKLAELTIRENEKRLRAAQRMAHLGYWELDVQLGKVFWSDELYNIFQLPLQVELDLDTVLAQVHPEDRKLLQSKIQNAIEKAESYTIPYRVVWPNGEVRYLITNGTPFKDDQGIIRQVKGISQDVTDREVIEQKLQRAYEELKATHHELKQSEETLRRFNNELEKRVIQRTKELSESNERLRRKNADLDNFIYTASHDLKVPIANIEGLLNILKSKVKDTLKENDQIVLNMMQESIERFNVTIQDLTQISMIQKNLEEETKEPVLVAEMLNDLTADMAELIAEKKAKVQVDLKVKHIYFTKKNFRSILYNLINNALKYAAIERKPTISIETEVVRKFKDNKEISIQPVVHEKTVSAVGNKQNEGYVMLKVQDNGLGIPEKQLEKIFSLFKRYHTHTEGSGIGLYIVKRIIENNGGKIKVESKVDFGTTFKLFFPYFSQDEKKV